MLGQLLDTQGRAILLKKSLWILAHYDDEVMGLHLIPSSTSEIQHVVYLTNSVPSLAQFSGEVRQKECTEAWRIGCPGVKISFLGDKFELTDGDLHGTFDATSFSDLLILSKTYPYDEIVSLTLEGGHQDHDITSLIAERIAMLLGIPLRTFPTYRGLKNRWPLYTVMTSGDNGTQELQLMLSKRINLAVTALRMISKYKSQTKTWLGLTPFIVLKYLRGGISYKEHLKIESWVQQDPKTFLYFNRNKNQILDYNSFRDKLMSF